MSRVDDIERDLEERRRQVAATAEALKRKLTPTQLARDAMATRPVQQVGGVIATLAPFAAVAAGIVLISRARARRDADRSRGPTPDGHAPSRNGSSASPRYW